MGSLERRVYVENPGNFFKIHFHGDYLGSRYNLGSHYFSIWSHAFLMRKATALFFEWLQTVIKMCEKYFVQAKMKYFN